MNLNNKITQSDTSVVILSSENNKIDSVDLSAKTVMHSNNQTNKNSFCIEALLSKNSTNESFSDFTEVSSDFYDNYEDTGFISSKRRAR